MEIVIRKKTKRKKRIASTQFVVSAFGAKKRLVFLLTQTGDALAHITEEGRARATKIVGELLRSVDPAVSEWGNPANFIVGHICTKLSSLLDVLMRIVGTSRTETSK